MGTVAPTHSVLFGARARIGLTAEAPQRHEVRPITTVSNVHLCQPPIPLFRWKFRTPGLNILMTGPVSTPFQFKGVKQT